MTGRVRRAVGRLRPRRPSDTTRRRLVEVGAVALAAVVAAVVAVVIVRGSDEGGVDPGDRSRFDAYCAEVEDQQAELSTALAEGPKTGLLSALPSFRALAAEAPDDIDDEWAVVTSSVESLRGALRQAGVDPAAYDPQQPPEGVSQEQQAAIEEAADAMLSARTRRALEAVQQQARAVCETPLVQGPSQ